MSFPDITTAPTAPATTDDPTTFNSLAFPFVTWMAGLDTEFNALSAAYAAWLTSVLTGTSATSVAIGTGSKSFTTQANLAFAAGQFMIIASLAAPQTDYMFATVTSYNSSTGALVVNVASGDNHGSGTHTDWSIGLAPPTATLAAYALLAGSTLTGATLVTPTFTGTPIEDVYPIVDGAAFEIDPANGSIQTITLGASRTPKGTNINNGQAVTLGVDDGTAYTLTWTDTTFGASGVKWCDSSSPSLGTTGYTWISLWKVGGQVYGSWAGNTG